MKTKAIILEIDGVLANIDHRKHLLTSFYNQNTQEYEPDHEAYHLSMDKDTVNEWCSSLIKFVASENWADGCQTNKYHILFVTERPGKYRETTYQWIERSTLYLDWEYIKLFMRSDYLAISPRTNLDGSLKCGDIVIGEDGKLRRNFPDHRTQDIVKSEIYDREIKDKYEVLFVLEQDNACCEMYKSKGLQVMKVM